MGGGIIIEIRIKVKILLLFLIPAFVLTSLVNELQRQFLIIFYGVYHDKINKI